MRITLSPRMIRFYLPLALIVCLIGMLGVAAELGLFDKRYLKTAEEVFGTKTGEPIETGFLFKDGTYVDAPYVVSRRGGEVYVNKCQVAVVLKWPPDDYDDKKPEMPKGLTKHSKLEDLDLPERPGDSLDRKMRRWLLRHYEKDEAKKRIAEYYRSLPFVKEVHWSTKIIDVLEVSTWDRDKPVLMSARGPVYRPITPEAALKELERVRTRWENRLKKGDCIFLFSSGELSFGSRKAAMDLGTIVATLRGGRPKEEKIRKLQRLGVLPPDFPRWWEVLITNFSASPQLDERIKQLRLPPGDKGEREPTLEEERARDEKMMKEKAAKEKESNK